MDPRMLPPIPPPDPLAAPLSGPVPPAGPGPGMDPMMMGGMPMMDPSMMGGPPPVDPAMMGGPMPMDPMAMMGGMAPPPEDPIPQDPFRLIFDLLHQLVDTQGPEMARVFVASLGKDVIDGLQAAAQDPEEAAFLDALLPLPEGPVYPKWFRAEDYPEPTKTEILEIAAADWNEWAPVREELTENLQLFHLEAGAVYEDEDQDEEHYISPALSDEVRAIAAMAGNATPTYEVLYTDLQLRDESQECEEALYHWDAEAEAAYQEAGNNGYRFDVAMYLLLTGHVAARVTLDLEGGPCPIFDTLVNPLTLVPTWDDRGLARVVRSYVDTVGNILADYRPDPAQTKALLDKAGAKREAAKKEGRNYASARSVQMNVIVYEDRYWYAVYADDLDVVPPVAHKCGYVRYALGHAFNSEPMGLTDDGGNVGQVAGPAGSTSSRSRLKYKHVSHFHFTKRAHAQKEAVLTKLYQLWRKADKPAWLVGQDDFAESEGTPVIDDAPGKVSTYKLNHEQITPLISQTPPAVFAPLIEALGQDQMTNRLAPAMFGFTSDANQSGNALEGLFEAGKDKLAVYVTAMEAFYAARAKLRLALWRDWGHLYQDESGEYGQATIPYAKATRRLAGAKPSFTLTPATVRRAGVRVKAHLVHLRLQNLAPLGNAVAIWMQNKAMSAREAMELRGVTNPDAVMAEILYETAMNDPDLQKTLALTELQKRDPGAAAIFHHLLALQAQPQGGPPGGPPPGGMGPQGPLTPDVNTNAMNLPALGLGQQGPTGRPAGPTSPPPPFGGPPGGFEP